MFPPSGLSCGSIIPHCDACNNLGPTTFALESRGKFSLRKCEIAELNDRRFKGCTMPTFLLCAVAPQFPLNAFLKPSSTILSLKYS